RTVYFAAGISSVNYQLRSATVSDHPVMRSALAAPGTLFMHDIARDGRWLVERSDNRLGTMAKLAGDTAERDLTWHGMEWGPSLSPDGRSLLFTDGNGGANYAVAVRKPEPGSPVVRLGEGAARDFSPDGKWVLARNPSDLRIVIYPTGAGEALHVD